MASRAVSLETTRSHSSELTHPLTPWKEIDLLAQHPELQQYRAMIESQRLAHIQAPLVGTLTTAQLVEMLKLSPEVPARFALAAQAHFADYHIGTGRKGYFLNTQESPQPWEHVYGPAGLEGFIRRTLVEVALPTPDGLQSVATLTMHHLGTEYVDDIRGPHRLASVSSHGGMSPLEIGKLLEQVGRNAVRPRAKNRLVHLLTLR